MKIAIARIKSALGAFEHNLDKHFEYINKARERKSDLVIFPELSLTGYSLKDITSEVAVCEFKALSKYEGSGRIIG